jgi:hypothetical protein
MCCKPRIPPGSRKRNGEFWQNSSWSGSTSRRNYPEGLALAVAIHNTAVPFGLSPMKTHIPGSSDRCALAPKRTGHSLLTRYIHGGVAPL